MQKINFKNQLKKLFFYISKNNFSWALIDKILTPITKFHKTAINYRKSEQVPGDIIHSQIFLEFKRNIYKELKVLNGPFKGMIYPSAVSIGSTFVPKILGSYEKEITNFINYILKQDYKNIIDVGCAEGYYAIGLGLRFKKSKIYAFDIDKNAQKQCELMAKVNNIDIKINGLCTKNFLKKLSNGGKSLIILDCEGYEKNLIDKEVADRNQGNDFLIETHDFEDISITDYILNSFRKTHRLEIIESIDDISKVYNYQFKELSGMTLHEKKEILSEYRPNIMRWVLAKAY